MPIRYVIRTVDEDWIDLVDEPVRIDDRRMPRGPRSGAASPPIPI